jgi:8-amino-7-oxononanoate synthase
MNLLEEFAARHAHKKLLLPEDVQIFGAQIEKLYSSTEAKIGDRRITLFGTNNYLGLTFAPQCLEAAHRAIDEEGTGTTGSRLANGSYSNHYLLEKEFADFYRCEHCIIFSTGYQANLGLISGLIDSKDVILLDAHCHASIYDGCSMTGADVIRFRHNDTVNMEKRLQRLGDRAQSTLIIVEGIYSMLGDTAPLQEIVRLKQKYGATLLVDEAHSLGVLGETGQGLVEQAGVLDQVDFITGTFSKSLGNIGGYCVSNHPQLDMIRYVSRPYIFTASSSPATIAATRAALVLLREGQALRKTLWQHSRFLYSKLDELGYTLGPEPGPVIAVVLDSHTLAIDLWRRLLDNGIYTNLVLPPATPDDKSLIRCSISAAHTTEQLEHIADVFSQLRKYVTDA